MASQHHHQQLLLQVTATQLWERQLPVEAGSACLLQGPGFEEAVVWVQLSGLALPVTVLQYNLGTQADKVVQVRPSVAVPVWCSWSSMQP
jgi:hypothetical protein